MNSDYGFQVARAFNSVSLPRERIPLSTITIPSVEVVPTRSLSPYHGNPCFPPQHTTPERPDACQWPSYNQQRHSPLLSVYFIAWLARRIVRFGILQVYFIFRFTVCLLGSYFFLLQLSFSNVAPTNVLLLLAHSHLVRFSSRPTFPPCFSVPIAVMLVTHTDELLL